jgi:hypothetical protein
MGITNSVCIIEVSGTPHRQFIIIYHHKNENLMFRWGYISPRWSSIRTRCLYTGNMAMFIQEVSEHLHRF